MIRLDEVITLCWTFLLSSFYYNRAMFSSVWKLHSIVQDTVALMWNLYGLQFIFNHHEERTPETWHCCSWWWFGIKIEFKFRIIIMKNIWFRTKVWFSLEFHLLTKLWKWCFLWQVGSLVSCFLAKRGHSVRIYEYRSGINSTFELNRFKRNDITNKFNKESLLFCCQKMFNISDLTILLTIIDRFEFFLIFAIKEFN